jgi:hypothetical protein
MAKRRFVQQGCTSNRLRQLRRSLGAKQDAPLFEYSQAEWSNIEAAIRAIRPDDWGPLPNMVREHLVNYARIYQIEVRKSFVKDNQDWQKIAWLSERLYEALRAISGQVVEYLKIRLYPEKAKHFRQWPEVLLEINDLAENMISPILGKADRHPARMRYQSLVLDFWVFLGGKLQSTRHPKTGRPGGPLIRFFQAVTTPVMGASAYSLESLPEIIRRRKRALEESAARRAAAARRRKRAREESAVG